MGARIYKEVKSSMQSGKARTGNWVLQYEQTEPKRPDPLMGWAGSGDTQSQVILYFPTLDAAVEYAKAQNLEYHVVPNSERRVRYQAYADNFSRGPLA